MLQSEKVGLQINDQHSEPLHKTLSYPDTETSGNAVRNVPNPASVDGPPLTTSSNDCCSWNNCITSKWCATSNNTLHSYENGILACVKSNFHRFFVLIKMNNILENHTVKIWTLSMNESSTEVPLVLVHGFGSGLALWALNLDTFAKDRPVYAIDLPGFAHSSRPIFGETPEDVERQYVQLLEEWRIKMNISTFILLGHSMGGFLCTAYSIQFPERVRHLILADPWGFQEKSNEYKEVGRIPFIAFAILRCLEPLKFNPLCYLRLLGRIGPYVIKYFRTDIIQSFEPELQDAGRLIPNYIFQCNTQEPTGEAAFTTLAKSFGWAKNPMINRIHLLDPAVPLTFIYGGVSWVDHVPLEVIQARRGLSTSNLTDLHILKGAAHHVYINKDKDTLNLFNKIVMDACWKIRIPRNNTNILNERKMDLGTPEDDAELT